jgi:UDP-N-acetylmuramoyl-tripeptide--D-alanyl-D-alanine ligase
MWTAEEVSRATAGRQVRGEAKRPFIGISTDTRTLSEGELFVALKGPRVDGHSYVKEALKKGATGCLVSDVNQFKDAPSSLAVIQVFNTYDALWAFANYHRSRLNLPIVAITGTCGKTTAKEMTAAAVGGGGEEVYRSPASFNNRIGVPLSLLSIRKRHRFAVLELGSSRIGEISRLSRLVQPTISVLTHVGNAHLDGLVDAGGVLIEKLTIIHGMKDRNQLLLDGDQEVLTEEAGRWGLNPITVGLERACRYYPQQVRLTEGGAHFLFRRRWISLQLFGTHNIRNALFAIAVCDLLKIPFQKTVQALERVQAMPGRLQLKRMGSLWVLDDSYNMNPSSVQMALTVVDHWPRPLKKVVILGDMLELGNRSQYWHRQVGEWVCEMAPDYLITCGPLAQAISDGAYDAGFPLRKLIHFRSSQSCAAQIRDIIRGDELVLVKGSRAIHMETVIERLMTRDTLVTKE